MKSWDVIVAGAGLAGVCTALELRQRGATVLVLERGEPGCEASSAAAGMLAATDPETPAALRPLALESARIYPEFVENLQRISGIQVDFQRHGTIILGEEAPPPEYRSLSAQELRHLEPALQAHDHRAFFVEEDSVDPRLLMRAAVRAAKLSGIEMRSNVAVQQLRRSGGQAEVVTDKECLAANAAVNCMGAWSGPPVKPRKGQMMYLQPSKRDMLQHVVRAPGAYIVPRSSGTILVGTTVEDVGFDKSVSHETIRAMHTAAALYLPELASAEVVESWAGLRPGSPDDLPVIGPTPEQNVFLASGLFRNGILLAPVVAGIVADLLTGKPAGLEIGAFWPARFAAAKANP